MAHPAYMKALYRSLMLSPARLLLLAMILALSVGIAHSQPVASASPVPTVSAAPAASSMVAPTDGKLKPAKKPKPIYEEGIPLLILLVVIVVVIRRLPKVDVGHSPEFLRRRVLNWLPLGLTYAFLYMARYNLVAFKDTGALDGADFGHIDGWGSIIYGFSFLINGPLTDRWGGRATILIAAAGALVTNSVIGILMITGNAPSVGLLTVLFCTNMYFQSFGAVSIVKVNSSWFHIKERGTFGGIFGILISLGLYFAYDWGGRIAAMTTGSQVPLGTPAPWLFLIPSMILVVFWGLCWKWVVNSPGQAGLQDFDPQDASSGQSTKKESALDVMIRMLTNKFILIIALIELCSGFLRQGILKWYRDFAKGIGGAGVDTFVFEHWGMVSAIAGITGGIFAGVISDRLFGNRRAPVAAFLYGIMLVGACIILPLLGFPAAVSWTIAFMAMAIIGVHGMLSGVASQDFGGKNNAGVATGLIDGFVYLGSAAQSFLYGATLPAKGSTEAHIASNWKMWPIAMIPVAAVGLALSALLWNARPGAKK
jgi:MFS transporter, OPA family, glycerol-3-phosphate transporter